MYQSIKYSIVIFIFSVIFCATMYSQENSILGEYPCGSDDGVSTYNVAATATSKQSSTNDVHDSSNAIDGNYSDASLAETNNDGNAWLEIELDKPTNVKELKIWYPSDKPLGKFYVLLSSLPFESGNLANELVSPNNEYLYVEALSSGSAIPIDRSGVKFIRIQNETAGPLSLLEVEVPGVSEICDNGKDDDCDGLVDCEDPDCSPSIYNVNYAHPTCPICFDGEIQIRASGENLKYSIDGGANFYSCNPIPNSQHCGFFNLGEGEYNIVVANEQCTTTYIGNPVILFPPEGTPRGSCFNGGFEEGTFEGWTGGIGLVSGNFFGDETIDPPGSGQTSKHQIISSSGDFDPYAGADIPLASPDGSAYFVRLGNAEEELRSQRLTYCLTAADDNRAFSFYYALVMEDGDRPDYAHAASQQPYFQWNILDGDGNVKREGEPIKADVDNPFFIVNEERFLVWLGWTKECFDLYEYVDEGEEICIEFITADCSVSANGHFSYAYIDGLCSDGVAPSPPALELNDAYCENQTVSVSAVGGNGYNQYDWTVCRYIDGIPLQCFITETTPGYSNPTLDNVLDFFFKDRPPSVKPLECGDKFKVTLTVRDDCLGSTSVSKDFTYICEQNEIDYLDIIVCSGLQDLPITGINDCNDCSVEWTPGQYLDDPSIPFPTILGSLNTLAFDQIYHVEVTNDFGCVYEDEIEIFEKSEIYGELTLEVNSL
ncbi:MAG TPA: hypothetical protein ENJ95_05675, partial [Bacteroidetes bacterium]|nr:hypothetical protein [Bacteroidota bacterium]